jgi:hypothetical protein
MIVGGGIDEDPVTPKELIVLPNVARGSDQPVPNSAPVLLMLVVI